MAEGAPGEYVRRCKQAGCGAVFVVSAPSLALDRMVGFSDPEYCPDHRVRHARSYARIAMHHPDARESVWGREALARPKPDGTVDLGPGGLGRFTRGARPLERRARQVVQREFSIAAKDDEILTALERHQVLVLVGETGSGKSTHVPHLLLRSAWSRRGPIVVTQPRILATEAIPTFVAQLNGSSYGPGAEVGYTHSREDQYDRRTRLLFMTDGKLINDIVSGRIGNYSVVMIDEAHERSVNIDVILGLMKDQLALYPHLRLIIASATIDYESFMTFYGGPERVGYVHSNSRLFHVEPHFWGEEDWWKPLNEGQLPDPDALPATIAELVRQLWGSAGHGARADPLDGHILVFLPGSAEIDLTVSRIRALGLPNLLCLPLYANRPPAEQQRAIAPESSHDRQRRRVIVSTNVAETSLTVEGVRHVIDSGYIKESTWNPVGRVAELRTRWHSQAGCRQRWGRAGRLAPGDAWLMYTREQFESRFPPFTAPGVARASMEEVLMTVAAAGVPDLRAFPWIPLEEETDRVRFRRERETAFGALQARGLLDEHGDLTPFGLELRGAQSGMDLAAAFALGDRYAMGVEVATLVPFLKLEHGTQTLLRREDDLVAGIEDAAERRELQWNIRAQRLALFAGCEDDLDLFVKLWMGWVSTAGAERAAWCERTGIDVRAFRDTIEEQRDRLVRSLADDRKAEERQPQIEKLDALRALLACALPHALYISTQAEDGPGREPAGLAEGDDVFALGEVSGPRVGVYRRLRRRPGESDDEALVEIIPTSVVVREVETADGVTKAVLRGKLKRDERSGPPPCCLICQRRGNFLRPARTAVLGMNVVRVDPAWIEPEDPTPSGQMVDRALRFAALSRGRTREEHAATRVRLLLSLVLPVGTRVDAVLAEATASWRCCRLVVVAPNPELFPGTTQLAVDAWLPPGEADGLEPGEAFTATVDRYEGAVPVLTRTDTAQALGRFRARYRPGVFTQVVLRRVLKDPAGRLPCFLVEDVETGAALPMLPEDFCGNAPFRMEFGLRFEPGDRFTVRVEETESTVRVSRTEALLDEVLSVLPEEDGTVRSVLVERIDQVGAWVRLGRYVALVSPGGWPQERRVEVGDTPKGKIRARLRRGDRDDLVRARAEGKPFAGGVALGYDVDLRAPEAYARFARHYARGSRLTAVVDFAVNSGALVARAGDQRIYIPETELGLDPAGTLRRARSFEPGSSIEVLVTRMQEDRAEVTASVWCAEEMPVDLKVGAVVSVRVVLARAGDRPLCIGAVEGRYRIQLTDEGLQEGEWVQVRIDRFDSATGWLRGEVVP
jgi:HrpA-like RNA helicase